MHAAFRDRLAVAMLGSCRERKLMGHPFQIVDVFGTETFSGNPLAVVTTRVELDTETMLRITRWLNFSETTFLLPPTDPAADYRVRIFTPARELPFAGHPTLGTCHVWLEGGGVPTEAGAVVQECGAGLVRLRTDGRILAFAAPPVTRSGPVDEDDLQAITGALQIDPADVVAARWVDNGPGWVAVMLGSADAVLAVEPMRRLGTRLDVGVVGLHPKDHPSAAAYEIRAFFTDAHGGMVEDPVCGSLNASVAQWLTGEGIVAAPYSVTQGARVDRDGRITVDRDEDGQVWIGGATRSLFSGTAEL
jgi:PhzF family phenazine biosynthesis protein